MGNLGVPELLIIAGVIILLFGARKLPEMARSLGKSAKAFKEETKGMRGGDSDDDAEPDTKHDAKYARSDSDAPATAQPAQPQLPQAQPPAPSVSQQVNGSQPVEQTQQNKNAS